MKRVRASSDDRAISVVIPAFQAEETLAETLDSLLAQTFRSWEAIVVDDGSSDGTAEIAAAYERRDARFRLIRAPHRGVSRTRDLAVESARNPWLFLLDADDLVLPHHLESLVAAVAGGNGFSAAYAGWAQLLADGRRFAPTLPELEGDLFPALADRVVFPVHAALIPTHLYAAAGASDPRLSIGEDWDLWQRIARTGARFAAVRQIGAIYRTRPGSASMDGSALWTAGCAIMARARRPDPRVREAAPEYANGLPQAISARRHYLFLAWCAALELGRRRDALPLLAPLVDLRCPHLEGAEVAAGLFHYGLLPTAAAAEAWDDLWPKISRPVEEFLGALERQSGARALAAATIRELHRLVALHLEAERSPVRVAGAWVSVVEATAPLAEVRGPQERLVAAVRYDGEPLGVLELPIFEGVLPQIVLRDGLAANHSLEILGMALRRPVYDRLAISGDEIGWTVSRDGAVIATGDGPPPAGAEQLHARLGWCVFLQELWGRPTWSEIRFYDPLAEPAASEARCGGPHLPLEISAPLPDLDLAGASQRIQLHLGGVAFGELLIEPGSTLITASDLRARVTRAAGAEVARVAVREALVGRPLLERAGELRARLADAAARRQEERRSQGGSRRAVERELAAAFGRRTAIVPHRDPTRIDSPASRWAALPGIRPRSADEVAKTPAVYAPGVLPGTGRRPASAPPVSVADPTTSGGQDETSRLPILLYHRVSNGRDDVWTLAPDQFRTQIDHLVENGYYTVGLEQWQKAMECHAPLPGRAVLLSFDDACADFASVAWPILRAAGFGASIFVVVDEAGGTNRWDQGTADAAPLLGWRELAELARQGVEIGSHSLSHPDLRALSPSEIFRELHDSRGRIEQHLGRPAPAFAYPYGLHDGVVRHLAGAAGYRHGLTIRNSAAGLWEDPLALPRIEVRRHVSLDEFARSLRASSSD